MAVDFDTKLTDLAAQILREAARAYGKSAVMAWLPGYSPMIMAWDPGVLGGLGMTSSSQVATRSFQEALTGSLPTLTGSLQALTASFQTVASEAVSTDQATLKGLFRLPRKLPGVRLPSDQELALAARSAPIMVHLEALAKWLGDNGRLVTADDLLHTADATDAVRALDIRPDYLPYLWEYGLASGWIALADETDGRQSWAVLGPTASRWADGDVPGTLHVWAAIFAAVLAVTLDVAISRTPGVKWWQKFQGQGAALAVMMFLARQIGLTADDVTDFVRNGAIGEFPTGRARKAWDAWVHQFGDPAHRLLTELAALHAVVLPSDGEGIVTLASLAQWAMRELFTLEGINVPVVRRSAQLSAADLIGLTGGLGTAEFDAEFKGWLTRCGSNRAAQELLLYAGSANPDARLIAVKLVRQIGSAAIHAWLNAMQRPELRGYARIALSMMAADLPESSLPLVLNPDPDDLDGVASDLLLLIGDDDIPDPDRIEALFGEIAPKGEEEWIIGLLAGGRHRDVVRLLEVLGHYYADRHLAKSARKAARAAAKNRPSAGRDRVSARR
jgi:hypothetical protein